MEDTMRSKMEGKPSKSEIHAQVFYKKKKKHSVCKEKPGKHARESCGDSPLGNDQLHVPKRKKKKKDFQLLISSPPKKSEICDETEEVTSTHKKNKKRRKDLSGVDEETGVAYVLVNKENVESMPVNFRKDLDVVYVDVSGEQKSAQGRKAEEYAAKSPRSVPAEWGQGAKRRKNRSPGREAASFDALPQLESHPPPALPAGLEGNLSETPVSTGKKKSKKKKKKRHREQELPAGATPEALAPSYPSGQQAASEAWAGEGSGALKPAEGSSGAKKKMKRRKHAPVVAHNGSDGDSDNSALDRLSESACPPSPQDLGIVVGESVTSQPQKERAQARTGDQPAEEAQRLSPAGEEQCGLESPGDSTAKPVSEDWRDSDGDSDVDLGFAVRQLQEFIPDIKDRAPTTIKRMYRDDLGRFKEFKAQGVAIRFGKFSVKENKQIERNVQEFLSLTGIESADKLLYTDRYPEEKSAITELKRKHAFRLHIGKGIARPWKLVYYRAKKMFDINNYKGRYSQGDMEKLKAYHSLHGNDWKKIGAMVARSSLSVALKFSQIGSQRNQGAWSKTETQKLIKAVEEVILKKMSPQEMEEMDSRLQENPESRLSIVRERLYKGISWVEVEAKVETRNWMQCKSKWTEILTKRMTNGGFVFRGVNALQAKINLIERLYEINVEDANEIDWEDLASAIGDVPPSYVQTKFYKLKAACVPFWQRKTFPEIIGFLHETSLPLLKEKLAKKMERKGARVQTPTAPKHAFLFRDIFHCDEDSGEDAEEQG